jgi:hypothetical protein
MNWHIRAAGVPDENVRVTVFAGVNAFVSSDQTMKTPGFCPDPTGPICHVFPASSAMVPPDTRSAVDAHVPVINNRWPAAQFGATAAIFAAVPEKIVVLRSWPRGSSGAGRSPEKPGRCEGPGRLGTPAMCPS